MAIYSHSKLSTFEQCRFKYKLQYIDRVKVIIPTTIEAFVGSCVHKALEKLYQNLKYKRVLSKEAVVKVFHEEWEKEWSEDILIVKEIKKDDYKKMGEKFLEDYYKEYFPFNQFTILGLETEERLKLSDGSLYHIRIDRLSCLGETYYVCDYKTNSKMKSQEDADKDRQLAMYSIWVHNNFKSAKRVVLVWHMLAFNKEMTSERTKEELKQLESETIKLIKEIENAKTFTASVSALCDYCVFKHLCPSFKHEANLEELSVKEYKKDEGVKLVNEFALLKEKEKEIGSELEKTKGNLIGYAKQEKIDVVYGSNNKASVKEYEKIHVPEENKEKLEDLLKKKGLYEQLSLISWGKLNSQIIEGNIDNDIVKLTKKEKDWRISLSKKKAEEED